MTEKLSDRTTAELIAARDALAPRLRQEQRADWHETRHKYLALANEIAYRQVEQKS